MPPLPSLPQPEAFFTVRSHHVSLMPSACGLCVGYEKGRWRTKTLVDHIVEWLPEFALAPAEFMAMQHANSVEMIRRAARIVYETKKFRRRGEFGELFLHAAIRQVYDSLPAISKIYYKSAANDTVKGFDAVHIVGPPHDMELWLGEAKLYNNITRAIASVTAEIHNHIGTNYLRSEFILIANKIDNTWPHSHQLRKLLSPGTSLDEVFKRACIPVLLTYNSPCVAAHTKCTAAYIAAFENEIATHLASFATALRKRRLPSEIRVHLFLLPLHSKPDLVSALDGKLKAWQKL